jgi:hypothetical protein
LVAAKTNTLLCSGSLSINVINKTTILFSNSLSN